MADDSTRPHGDWDGRHRREEPPTGDDPQPDPDSSSDGDGSWTEDPITADPHEDRSVEAVVDHLASEH